MLSRSFALAKGVSRMHIHAVQVRTFVKVGDKVPVTYLKDETVPLVKADSEYPEWLFTIAEKGASKGELLEKYEKVGAEAMTKQERQRLKRLIGLDQIRESNAAKVAEG